MSANSATEDLTGRAWHEMHQMAMRACELVGLDHEYCDRVDIGLGQVTFHLYKGRDGRCKGPKCVVGSGHDPREPLPDPLPDGWGEAARETVTFELPTRDA